ncbi:YbfB/YjiJ family MFS transporter [uncultured Planktomarina sp.]|uniref:YbfB/YjiJ family MFS transporter n=1 Tax=uncultured Planktomarina sp. TaxID=1538529 RepID=UPI0032615C7B
MTELHKRPWLVLAGLALGVTVTNGFARFAYGLIVPAMQSDLGWNYAQAGWLNTANALGYIAGAVLTMVLIGRYLAASLFSFGLVTTNLALLSTGLVPDLWWQTLWRILAGFFGAMSFSTAGVLAAGLFANDPRRNALAIAIVFGTGGGLAIVVSGASLPLFLGYFGADHWPIAWIIIAAICALFSPLCLWSAAKLKRPAPKQADASAPLQLTQIWAQLAGYAGFGLGYIVFLTFLSAWMTQQAASAGFIAAVWVLLGLCICVSPFVWRPILARHASGLPLAMILTCISLGSALPVVFPGNISLLLAAIIFGLSVFMAPTAVTNFARQNLPAQSWGAAISLFTVVFAIAQTLGPYAAGLLGDLTGDIGISLLGASGLLLLGAVIALTQKPLPNRPTNPVEKPERNE